MLQEQNKIIVKRAVFRTLCSLIYQKNSLKENKIKITNPL